MVARGDDDSSSSSESEAEEHEDDEAKERRAREKLQRERDEERKRIEAGEFIPEEGEIENKDLNKVRIAFCAFKSRHSSTSVERLSRQT